VVFTSCTGYVPKGDKRSMLFVTYRHDSVMAVRLRVGPNDFMQLLNAVDACRRHVGGALRRLDNSIMPLRCVFCGTESRPPEGRLCRGCYSDLPWITNACARCAEPVATELPSGVYCAACQKREPPFQATVAPLRYEFPVDAGLKALKFGRRLYYAPAFGELLLAEMRRLPPDIDALLPVPLHWRRQAFRGFNQAAELCKPLARRYALPIVTGVARRRATPFQSGLAASERSKNLRRAFVVRKTSAFRHILIVDDVVTTGETTRQLARALIRSGVRKVSVVAVARAA
jgi:ComF family protein